MNNFQYLTTETDGKNRLWIELPAQDKGLSLAPVQLLQELNSIFRSAAESHSLSGLILYAKHTGSPAQNTQPCIEGKPLNQQQVLANIKLGQEACQYLTAMHIPSVVLIDSIDPAYCMMLAMAATYCIASDDDCSNLAFTETSSGLHPNIHSTQHAIQRMGINNAMDYLLTGISLTPKLAEQIGLIDYCLPSAQLQATATDLIDRNPGAKHKRSSLSQKLHTITAARKLGAMGLREKARMIGQQMHYPAPYALIKLWQKYGLSNTTEAQEDYANSIARLSQEPQAQNLNRVKKLKQRLQHSETSRESVSTRNIHLIGSGMTAADIATYLLLQGQTLTLQDKQTEAIEQTFEIIKQNLAEHFSYRDDQITSIMANLTQDQEGRGAKTADLVLVVKGLSLADSQEIFAELEEQTQPDTILATHSTTLSMEKIAAALLNPDRLIGIHFCYPAFKNELTEVSFSKQTDLKLLEKTLRLLQQLKKIPLPMKNNPGLLVDRVLVQYILQGIRLHQQGVPHTVIDRAGRDSGMPDGPLEFADKMGLDYCLRVAEVLERTFNIEIPYHLIEMVKTGKLGIKSGTGFYRYRNGNRLKPDRVEWDGSKQALQEKLTNQIREEASICLEDGLIEDPDLIDAGIVFGTGFAPWQGGPLYQQRNRTTRNKRA
ncbi:MAG: 3-hydroxyacyl-CoA dehydrogenase NAD-binding domain-containing protein [Thiolinea sp.]